MVVSNINRNIPHDHNKFGEPSKPKIELNETFATAKKVGYLFLGVMLAIGSGIVLNLADGINSNHSQSTNNSSGLIPTNISNVNSIDIISLKSNVPNYDSIINNYTNIITPSKLPIVDSTNQIVNDNANTPTDNNLANPATILASVDTNQIIKDKFDEILKDNKFPDECIIDYKYKDRGVGISYRHQFDMDMHPICANSINPCLSIGKLDGKRVILGNKMSESGYVIVPNFPDQDNWSARLKQARETLGREIGSKGDMNACMTNYPKSDELTAVYFGKDRQEEYRNNVKKATEYNQWIASTWTGEEQGEIAERCKEHVSPEELQAAITSPYGLPPRLEKYYIASLESR